MLLYNNSDIYIYYCTCSPCVSSVYLAIHLGYLRGVDVIDHITFAYTGKAQSFEWLNRGFKIHFPENALPPGVDKCRVHIKASLSGQFDFSRDVELVSGLYWLSSRHVFTRPVTVEIQHCAQEDAQQQFRLTYIVASCSQEELPYQFKPLEGGVFSPSSQYGTINLTHLVENSNFSHERDALCEKTFALVTDGDVVEKLLPVLRMRLLYLVVSHDMYQQFHPLCSFSLIILDENFIKHLHLMCAFIVRCVFSFSRSFLTIGGCICGVPFLHSQGWW